MKALKLKTPLLKQVLKSLQINRQKKSPFPDQQALDDLIESFTPEELQKQAETILKPTIELIKQGKSYEEILKNLSEKNLDTSQMEEVLSNAIFISEIWGRLNGEH